MPASSRQAVDAYLRRHRQLVACVTDRPLLTTAYRPSSAPHTLFLAPTSQPAPVRRTGGGRLGLAVEQEFVLDPFEGSRDRYDVRTTGYYYTILDAQGRELLAYHWHPTGPSPVTLPHLHLTSRVRPIELAPNEALIPLAEMHLPTGLVTLADVVWLLIIEFGMEPRRADWANVLAQSVSIA